MRSSGYWRRVGSVVVRSSTWRCPTVRVRMLTPYPRRLVRAMGAHQQLLERKSPHSTMTPKPIMIEKRTLRGP